MEKTNLYSISVPPMIKALKALSAILDKAMAHAETKGSEWHPGTKQMEALLNDRLVFDQFTLMRQIQIACDNAKGAVGRLAEIKLRIEKTIKFLETVKPEQIAGKEELKITLPYFPTKYFTGFEYVTEHVIPNFFFHVTTAYAILRKNARKHW